MCSSTRRLAKLLTVADLARSSASLLLSISNWLPAATDARKLSVDGVATAGGWLAGGSAAKATVPAAAENKRERPQRIITRLLIVAAPFAANRSGRRDGRAARAAGPRDRRWPGRPSAFAAPPPWPGPRPAPGRHDPGSRAGRPRRRCCGRSIPRRRRARQRSPRRRQRADRRRAGMVDQRTVVEMDASGRQQQ